VGFVQARITVEGLAQPAKKQEFELLVDTGALFSMLPAATLDALGVKRTEKMEFETASGQVMTREIGYAWFRHNGRQALSPVIFGEEGDKTVLGVVTLETLRMEVDPVRNEIRPVRGKMY
jgi:predicted aspartyl protease